MAPVRFDLFGFHVAAWDVMFLVAVTTGYGVVRATAVLPRFASGDGVLRPRYLFLRYIVTVYVTTLGAQLFSYAFDYGTTLLPPSGTNALAYYLDPRAGPKTLYGAVLALPLAIAIVRRIPSRVAAWSFGAMLDLWTPPLLAVLAIVRVGCFLQGCCYGVESHMFGLRFAEGSIVYTEQVARGLITAGEPMIPVVPTQAIEALFLFAATASGYRALVAGRERVFVHAIAAYSVFRFAIELVRADPARNHLGPFSTSQWVAVGLSGLYAVWRSRPASAVTESR